MTCKVDWKTLEWTTAESNPTVEIFVALGAFYLGQARSFYVFCVLFGTDDFSRLNYINQKNLRPNILLLVQQGRYSLLLWGNTIKEQIKNVSFLTDQPEKKLKLSK